MKMTPIRKAIAIIGTQTEAAKILGVTPQAVSLMVNKNKVPPYQVLKVEAATGGEVTCFELDPELYPRERFER